MKKIAIAALALIALAGVAHAGPGIGITTDPNSMSGNGSQTDPLGLRRTCTSGQQLVYDGVHWGCALAGDITSVGATAGGGLTGGATSGPALLGLLTTCGTNQILKWSGSAWACANDAAGTGTVTNIATTAPISGGPITSTGTIGLTNCGANQIYKENGTGTSWGCAADADSGGTITNVIAGTGLSGGGSSGSVTLDVNCLIGLDCNANNINISNRDWGDVTSSDPGGAPGTVWTVDNNAITYAKMQDVSASSRFIGRITAGSGDPEELTGTQATTLLDPVSISVKGLVPVAPNDATKFFRGDATWAVPPTFGTSNAGYVPASGGGTTNFMRADGTWANPGGIAGLTTNYVTKASSATAIANSNVKDDGTNWTINTTAGGSTAKFTVVEASGNTTIAGTLDTTGNFNVNTNKFQVVASSGDTVAAGTANAANFATAGTVQGGTVEASGKFRTKNACTATPTLTCGTSALVVGCDAAGTVIVGTGSPGTCVITFNVPYVGGGGFQTCTVTAQNGTAKSYSVSTTAITINAPVSSTKYDYVCVDH